MATVSRVKVEAKLTVTLELSEIEVRALDGIFGYNADAFLKAFYEKMGRAYVEPFEPGVRSLHQTVRSACAGPLAEIDKGRAAMKKALSKV